ncbi:MAG: OprD family outer membrane porin [Kiritimatiellales bacterium]
MKNGLVLCLAAVSSAVLGESVLTPVNELGYGTVSMRLQTLSMYRDYENATPGNAYSTTAGLLFGYTSPELSGFSVGGTWIYAEPLDASDDSRNGKTLLSNGRVNLLNEAWVQYRFGAVGLTNTFVKAGRQVINGELFRADEIRQKPRSLEAVQLTVKDLPGLSVTVGHAWRLSNVLDNEDSWRFNDFEEVLTPGKGYDSRGITWGEMTYTGVTHLQAALYEAYVHDIANVFGGRARYAVTDRTALLAYFQHANSVQSAESVDPFDSDMFSAAIEQKIGRVTLESGWFGVHGDSMLFHEMTTGLNHPMGNSLMVYAGHFNGGADSAYLKATTKVGKTFLYMLYNYTWQNDSTMNEGQEINFVVKQPLFDNFSATFKYGAGYRDGSNGADDTVATDARLFLTYNF